MCVGESAMPGDGGFEGAEWRAGRKVAQVVRQGEGGKRGRVEVTAC